MNNRCRLLVGGLAIVLSACASARLQKTETYSFGPGSHGYGMIRENSVIVGLGPIEISDYLDRPQLLRRDSQGRIRLYDLHRWDRPLRDSIRQTLAAQLESLDAHREVRLHPWSRPSEIDFQVRVSIESFEPGEDHVLELRAHLLVRDVRAQVNRNSQSISLQKKLDGPEFSRQVDGMHDLLLELASSIHRQLRPVREMPLGSAPGLRME